MNIETGTPSKDGRYVVLIQCLPTSCADWVEPIIAAWFDGKWNCPMRVFGWAGPIPPIKVETLRKLAGITHSDFLPAPAKVETPTGMRPALYALDDLGSDGEYELEPVPPMQEKRGEETQFPDDVAPTNLEYDL